MRITLNSYWCAVLAGLCQCGICMLLGYASTISAQPTDSLATTRKVVGQLLPHNGEVIDRVSVTNPKGACIVVRPGVANVVISNSRIGPCGDSNVDDYGVLILDGAKNISIVGNVIFNVSTGVKAHKAHHPVIVDRNFFYGIRGPMWSGQAVQFNGVYGEGASSRVKCNVSDAFYGTTGKSYEDHISMYDVHGTATYPVEIAGNRIRGGTSRSGGGITVGDKGGEWLLVRDNTVITVANSGIGVAGGSNIRVEYNRVDNRGATPSSLTHMAYYVRALSMCSNVTLLGNRGIARLWIWGETDGRTAPGYRHGPERCVSVDDKRNRFGDTSLSIDLFEQVPETCKD